MGKWREQYRSQQPNLLASSPVSHSGLIRQPSSNKIGKKLTSLKISHMSGPFDMIACSRKASIPLTGGRRTLDQHQYGLINVDNHPADRDKVEKPFLLGMGSVLNAEKKSTNGQFAESDRVQYDNLPEPGPFHRGYHLRQGEEVYVIA